MLPFFHAIYLEAEFKLFAMPQLEFNLQSVGDYPVTCYPITITFYIGMWLKFCSEIYLQRALICERSCHGNVM